MNYEFEIIPGATESNKKRNKILIFSEPFLNKIKCVNEASFQKIQKYSDWFNEIKEFRDPAAHRIPLYCPPGVITDDKINKLKEAKQKCGSSNYEQDPTGYMNAITELHKIGQFEPIFIHTSETEDKIYQLQRTTDHDFEVFWNLSDTIIDLFKKAV